MSSTTDNSTVGDISAQYEEGNESASDVVLAIATGFLLVRPHPAPCGPLIAD